MISGYVTMVPNIEEAFASEITASNTEKTYQLPKGIINIDSSHIKEVSYSKYYELKRAAVGVLYGTLPRTRCRPA